MWNSLSSKVDVPLISTRDAAPPDEQEEYSSGVKMEAFVEPNPVSTTDAI